MNKVLIVVLVMVTGCSSRSTLIGVGVGTAAIIAGGLLCADAKCDLTSGKDQAGVVAALYGFGVLGIAMIGGASGAAFQAMKGPVPVEETAESRSAREAEERAAQERAREAARRDMEREALHVQQLAMRLFERARTESDRGDCASAVATSKEVATLDADFYSSTVLRDAAIAKCFPGAVERRGD